ncbi:hypothetical protein AB6A23_10545 [Paenibacillus tarimensis]
MTGIPPDPAEQRILRMLDSSYPLCKTDVIWILEWIKKKVACDDPNILGLSQPRLLRSFHCFADAAMYIINERTQGRQEAERLRAVLSEAVRGVTGQNGNEA